MGVSKSKNIRTELKQFIDAADESTLAVVKSFIESEEFLDLQIPISEGELSAIREGMQQLKAGEGIPHNEVVKKYDSWFPK